MVSSQFEPTGGKLTADQISVGYWFVTHKLLLRRILVLVLFAVNIVLFLFATYGFLDYYLLSRTQTKQMYLEMTTPKFDYAYLYEVGSAQPLNVNFTEVLESSDNKYDFVSEVVNSNTSWYASRIVYHFEANDYTSESKTDYILPGQTKYLMDLGQEIDFSPERPNLIIESIGWQKESDYEKLEEKVLNFEIADQKFIPSSQNEASEEVAVNSLEYSVKNNSAYNFWDVTAKVLLFRNNQLVSVNEVLYKKIDSGESLTTQYNIYKNISTPNKIIIMADVDILNSNSYRGFDGEGQPK